MYIYMYIYINWDLYIFPQFIAIESRFSEVNISETCTNVVKVATSTMFPSQFFILSARSSAVSEGCVQ